MEKGRNQASPPAGQNDSDLTVVRVPTGDTTLGLRNNGNGNYEGNRQGDAIEGDGDSRAAAPAPMYNFLPGIRDLSPEQIHKKALLQCALLEMGILFHSVFIGMALSVTGGPGFVILLIAIIFHRSSSILPLLFNLPAIQNPTIDNLPY
jgi:hypothetical protein